MAASTKNSEVPFLGVCRKMNGKTLQCKAEALTFKGRVCFLPLIGQGPWFLQAGESVGA